MSGGVKCLRGKCPRRGQVTATRSQVAGLGSWRQNSQGITTVWRVWVTPEATDRVFLGDIGYMLRDWLLTPILNPWDCQEGAYTDVHCITRSIVERGSCVLKRRWHCLHSEICLTLTKACKVICYMRVWCCTAVQHNSDCHHLQGMTPTFSQTTTPYQRTWSMPPAVAERVRNTAGKARDAVVRNYFW